MKIVGIQRMRKMMSVWQTREARLMDASDRECDPYAIPPGFIATTIAIHLGKRIG